MKTNHVVSLEMAKRLKENGYPQNTEFYWWEDKIKDKYTTKPELCFGKPTYLKNVNVYCAPLSSELGEELPEGVSSFKVSKKWPYYKLGEEFCCESGDEKLFFYAETEADCRAKLWLYLKQNNLICN